MDYCCCSCPDADPPEIFKEEIRKARKIYKCIECGKDILPGERYEHVQGRWEGYWGQHRTCIVCKRIRDDLCSCGFIYGQLRDAVWDCMGIDIVTGEMEEDEDEEDTRGQDPRHKDTQRDDLLVPFRADHQDPT